MDLKDGNVELINEAIKRLLEERKYRGASGESFFQGGGGDEEDDRLLLSRLLSQLESLKGSGDRIHRLEDVKENDELESGKLETNTRSGGGGGGGGEEIDKQEIVKELNKLKRQNTITHWLLSVMIVLTVAWQASEMTMLLKFKQGLSNPIGSIGSMVSGLFSGRGSDHKAKQEHHNGAVPSLKMPDLPSVELPDTVLNGEKH